MKTTYSLNSAILLFLGQHVRDGCAQMTVTYQYNTSDLKVMQLRCDGSNSSNSSGAAVTTRAVTSRPMCIVEYYDQSCFAQYPTRSFENYPYFRPTDKEDFVDIQGCEYYEYDDDVVLTANNNGTAVAPFEGAVTVTCDAACTCDTGSYDGTVDEDGKVVGYAATFIPDGKSCPVISTQPGEQVGPSSPPMPPKNFSGTNVGPDEHMQVWCDGGDEDEALFGDCISEGFSSWDSFKSTEWEYDYYDCTDGGRCLVTCPSICTCTVMTTTSDGTTQNQSGYACEETEFGVDSEETTSAAASPHSMKALLQTLGIFLACSITAASILS